MEEVIATPFSFFSSIFKLHWKHLFHLPQKLVSFAVLKSQ